MSELMQKATDTVSKAIAEDNAKNYEAAFSLYQRALEQFVVALKYEKNKKSREIVQSRVEGYLKRAEVLKQALKDQAEAEANPKKKAAAVAGGGKGETSEADKLKESLGGAIVTEKPNVAWDDVAGLEGAKDSLKEAVILPAKFPQLFTGKRRPWKGILLYGPPGTGKSYLAKAVATEADSTFYSVSSSDLVSKWQGESERLVRNLFEMARESAPSIIFIDEVDSLCGARGEGENDAARRIKTEFLVQMQGVGKGDDQVLVLGATNTPWSLDPAMRRRFEKRIYIPLPEDEARATMFKIHVGDTPSNLDRVSFKELGELSAGFSGSDISVVVREALMEPLRIAQQAKYFRVDPKGMYHPIEETVPDEPPCMHCAMCLSSEVAKKSLKDRTCPSCKSVRMTLFEVESDKLVVPTVTKEHFKRALENSTTSVSPDELIRFVEWTSEFGTDGSA